jgi:hypothetical protein
MLMGASERFRGPGTYTGRAGFPFGVLNGVSHFHFLSITFDIYRDAGSLVPVLNTFSRAIGEVGGFFIGTLRHRLDNTSSKDTRWQCDVR